MEQKMVVDWIRVDELEHKYIILETEMTGLVMIG